VSGRVQWQLDLRLRIKLEPLSLKGPATQSVGLENPGNMVATRRVGCCTLTPLPTTTQVGPAP